MTARWGRALALGLVAWSLFGLGSELWALHERRLHFAWPGLPPQFWRLGNRATVRLERCLQEARTSLPPSSVTVVAAPGIDDESAVFHWVVYLLPERRFVLHSDDESWTGASFLFSYGGGLADPRLQDGRQLACGWLYRVRAGSGT